MEDRVKSFVTITEEQALEQARQADQRIADGQTGPLTGVPVQIKDVICTPGVPTTCGSRMLQDYVPMYNATAAARAETDCQNSFLFAEIPSGFCNMSFL